MVDKAILDNQIVQKSKPDKHDCQSDEEKFPFVDDSEEDEKYEESELAFVHW